MKTSTTLLSTFAIIFLTGCIQSSIDINSNYYNTSSTKKELIFSTNEHNFMHSLDKKATKQNRNSYMDEFILKSDMQCTNFLNQPLKKTDNSNKNDSLYMSIADTIGTLFGLSYITNTAKAVFLEGNNKESIKDKTAYTNALSPEMRKGVEIARARFAKEMKKKQVLPLDKYSIENLKEDTLKYDKQCNLEYGLIEINRALKEMQSQMNTRVVTKEPTTPTIDPKVIKDKVAQATKEVKEKQEEEKQKKKPESSKQIKTSSQEDNKTAILSV